MRPDLLNPKHVASLHPLHHLFNLEHDVRQLASRVLVYHP
jgi:hypothetical protein